LSKYKTPLVRLFQQERFVVYRCEELTNEICETLLKEKFKNIFSQQVFDDFFRHYEGGTRLVVITSSVKVCRDPKDNYLLSLSRDAKADYLITGDKDLLSLKKFERLLL
jgi:putative PIN family toxin of toxin-antitoxin system